MDSFSVASPANELPPYDRPVSPVAQHPGHATPEESLVTDVRAGLTPAQMVERKLLSLLKSNPQPVSPLMTRPRTGLGQ
jgi:hypothetical protein